MKKYLFFPAVAMTIFVACNQKEMDFNKESVTEPEIETVQMTFRAATEDAPTKTTLDEGTGAVAWAAGDAVKFVYELDGTPGYITSDALAAEDINGEGVATFTANLPKAFTVTEEEYQAGDTKKSLHLYAVSPASIDIDYETASSFYLTVPTDQDGSFASASIALAKWNKTAPSATLKFYNLCGLLKFTVTDAAVRKVVLHSDDYIAGKMDISFTGPAVKNVKDGKKTITVNVSGAGTYYIAVLPTNEEKGIGINNIYVELLDASDNLIGDKASADPLVIARKQIRSIGTLTTGFDDRFYVKVGGSGDGTSWDKAANITALNAKLESNNSTLNVFMAAGTYNPTAQQAMGTAHTKARVIIQGGFPANATGYALTGRDITSNATVIDGGGDKRIWILQRGTWSISGITFQNACRASGTSDTGSALVIEGDASSSFTVKDCTFSSNQNLGTKSTSGGGAVRVSNAHANFTRCTFIGNKSCYFGGALYLNGTANVTATDCTFSANEEITNDGGAVYVNGGTTLTLNGCTFTDNTAKRNGGAIVIRTNGTVIADDCTFGEEGHPNKTTTAQGGAIYINSNGTLTATKCAFAYNSAATMGGAIESNEGTFNATGCTFKGNTSTTDGASIVTANASTIKLNQCILLDNVATKSTSDLYIGGTTTLYANACYFGQSSADTQIASAAPHRILTGSNTKVGFNNCVICGPFSKMNALTQLSGNTVIANSTIYSSVGNGDATNKADMASIYNGSTNENGCRIINSIVLNNTSEGAGRQSFSAASPRFIQVYNSVFSNTSGEGKVTQTNCVSGKYNADPLDDNAFPDNDAWEQKYLGTDATLPDGGAIKAYVWDGVCEGFTKTTLADIKTLISGTTGVGSAFLTWLESEDLKVNGKEALSVDIRGVARNTSAMWPGSYEQASGVASAPAFTVK